MWLLKGLLFAVLLALVSTKGIHPNKDSTKGIHPNKRSLDSLEDWGLNSRPIN
ncbi:unnamed protein product [Cylicocyclus nassatus]|uniref:Uncharacterized protein n=1 Tax=Cylicocyclus nassatus TaxID=53992 RepID=A0AA36M6E1_CYLNA|nr:unnamed protein product [Cylicocyclus nassatus]